VFPIPDEAAAEIARRVAHRLRVEALNGPPREGDFQTIGEEGVRESLEDGQGAW
jgi:hypothetical protein